jgi:hypothetical protein
VRWTLFSAVVLKVLDELLRVVAQVAEVNNASTRLQEKQLVEVLEKYSTRLMNRAENCLSGVREL